MPFAQRVARQHQYLARRGRGPDNSRMGGSMAHVASGDMVVPKALLDAEPSSFAAIVRAFNKRNKDWRTHMMGPTAATNPRTGMKEFQFELDEPDYNTVLTREDENQDWTAQTSQGGDWGGEQDSGGTDADFTGGFGGGPGIGAIHDLGGTPNGAGIGQNPENPFRVGMTDFGAAQPTATMDTFTQAAQGVHNWTPRNPPVEELSFFDEGGGRPLELGFTPQTGTPTPTPTSTPTTQTKPGPFDAGGSLSTLANTIIPRLPVIGPFTPGGMIDRGLGGLGDFFEEHGGPTEYGDPNAEQGPTEIEGPSDPVPTTTDTSTFEMPVNLGNDARGGGGPGGTGTTGATTPTPTATVPTDWTQMPGMPGGPDPWAEVFSPGTTPGPITPGPVTPADPRTTPTPGTIAQTGFSRPTAMPAPHFLNVAGGMTPLQVRSMLATYGVNSDDPSYRDPMAVEFYKNQLMRDLINDQGGLGDYGSILPTEHQFLQQVLGLDYQPGDTGSLLTALQNMPTATGGYGRPGQTRGAAPTAQLPQNATPLPNGGGLIPTFDGGYQLVGPDMTSQGIVYFDQNGDPTMDRSRAYLPGATAQLNGMANVRVGSDVRFDGPPATGELRGTPRSPSGGGVGNIPQPDLTGRVYDPSRDPSLNGMNGGGGMFGQQSTAGSTALSDAQAIAQRNTYLNDPATIRRRQDDEAAQARGDYVPYGFEGERFVRQPDGTYRLQSTAPRGTGGWIDPTGPSATKVYTAQEVADRTGRSFAGVTARPRQTGTPGSFIDQMRRFRPQGARPAA